jgi:hypothetical protein
MPGSRRSAPARATDNAAGSSPGRLALASLRLLRHSLTASDGLSGPGSRSGSLKRKPAASLALPAAGTRS